MARKSVRTLERATPAKDLIKRFAHSRGGCVSFRRQPAAKKLAFLRGKRGVTVPGMRRVLKTAPATPRRGKPFDLAFGSIPRSRGTIAMVRVCVQFPSGQVRHLEHRPSPAACRAGRFTIPGLRSGSAGDLYVSARIYFNDGTTISDASLTSVLSRNPHQLVITPRTWLVSGRAGRVEYDWDDDEFHCRAYGTITNGENSAVTYNRCKVKVTDGGVGGTKIDEFSFASGPLTVSPGGSAYRSIDTWYPKGSSVWDKFNKRWDLTISFTYESTGSIQVSDAAAYRPMSTVPINSIRCDDFTSAQGQAERDAVEIAAEILEDQT